MPREASTVYILGAGASREGGVPLSGEILPVGHRLMCDLARGTRGDYLERLGQSHLAAFERVFEFIACCFHGEASLDALDLRALPSIDGLWALVEIASRQRASFGPADASLPPGEVRLALLELMYHVLVGCRVSDDREVGYADVPNPYERFVERLGPRDAIIALNYDILLDTAFERAGFAIDYGTDVCDGRRDAPREDKIATLLKLHGSFNWLFCPTCQRLEYFGPRNVAHLPLEEGDPALCPIDGNPREHLIIPPSLVKSYDNLHLHRIWNAASQQLQACTRLVVAGYAMADTDLYVRYLVKQSTSINRALDRITVVNRSAESEQSYRALFGPRRVEALQMSFGEYVGAR